MVYIAQDADGVVMRIIVLTIDIDKNCVVRVFGNNIWSRKLVKNSEKIAIWIVYSTRLTGGCLFCLRN